jgi:hypothetical protein
MCLSLPLLTNFVSLSVLLLRAHCVRCVQNAKLKPQVVETCEEAYSLVLSKRCDHMFATSGNTISSANQKYCGRLSAVGAQFYDMGLSFLLRKPSTLTTLLSQAALVPRNSGKIHFIEFFLTKQNCAKDTGATVVFLRDTCGHRSY